MDQRTRVSTVGGGNMAEALIRGLLAAGSAPSELRASDPSAERRQHLSRAHGIESVAENAQAVSGADVVLLAVKPHVAPAAAASIADALAPEALVISIAAGVPTAKIEAELKEGTHVVRAMPNTPALVLAGATAVAAGTHATDVDLSTAQSLFEAVGRCVVVDEGLLDAVTGLSGSGPAYVMLVIEALADGGVKAGLPRAVAQRLAAQTVYGAAKLQIDGGEHPGVLKDRVTSPGGTTITGVSRLEAQGTRGAFIEAVEAAAARATALGAGDERDP